MKKNNLVLIGFMGSGKTTIGIKLSYRIRKSIDDTDKLLQYRQGKSVREIFEENGEGYFRELETALLGELVEKRCNQIFSVGGGTPIKEENRELLKKLGTVVYLRLKPETVYNRIKGDTSRPLLLCGNPLDRIKELMEARKEAYESCADIIIDVDELSVNEVVDKLQKEWYKRKRRCKMKLLVINGPNLNFLGIREKSVYGVQDYTYLKNLIKTKAKDCNCEVEIFQSNYEGGIIDRIQEAYFDGTQGIVINPGAYTHYSYAIRDALASIVVPKVEVHISNILEREEFRKVSVTAPVCDKQIMGQGLEGYLQAIDYILGV